MTSSFVNRDVNEWKITEVADICNGEKILSAVIGTKTIDGVESDFVASIRKSVLDNLRNGSYIVSNESSWKGKLIIKNRKGNYIEPLSETCY